MLLIDVLALICILILTVPVSLYRGMTNTRGVGDRRQAVVEGVLIGIPWPIGQRLYVHLAEIN